METIVDIVRNEEAGVEDSVAANRPTRTSRLMIADPVVYQLVRVDGNGRLVPATEDEVMAVEDLLEDDRSQNALVSNSGRIVEGKTNGEHDRDELQLKASEGLLLDNVKLDAEILNVPPDAMAGFKNVNVQPEQNAPRLASTADYISISRQGVSSRPSSGLVENGISTSAVVTSSKPDFSMLKGEIHLENLTVRELQETFKATFGRETSVKDKQWLKRRILMGLTNSCDFSTTILVIKDNGVVIKGKEETFNSVEHNILMDPVIGSTGMNHESQPTFHDKQKENDSNATGMEFQNYPVMDNYGSEDVNMEQRATKRVRKPTRRYIEELSEGESRDSCAKLVSSVGHRTHSHSSTNIHATPLQKVGFDGRWLIRQDSLGGSGVQVPYVSRIRRSRPRENFMNLMPVTSPEKLDTERKLELEKELKNLESHENSEEDVVTIPANGRMRRKHHRPWTLSEVVKLVEGVANHGAGRWSEIKRLAFASYSYRTSVDLKDKWRNLLRASLAQLPSENGVQTQSSSRKHASIPIPAPILSRVRELAEMQAHVPPSFSASKFVGQIGSDRGSSSIQE